MREIEAGGHDSITEVGEVFKYIESQKCQYTLIALHSNNDCEGCVFHDDSGHPLSRNNCRSVGLYCVNRKFKPVDGLLEDL